MLYVLVLLEVVAPAARGQLKGAHTIQPGPAGFGTSLVLGTSYVLTNKGLGGAKRAGLLMRPLFNFWCNSRSLRFPQKEQPPMENPKLEPPPHINPKIKRLWMRPPAL